MRFLYMDNEDFRYKMDKSRTHKPTKSAEKVNHHRVMSKQQTIERKVGRTRKEQEIAFLSSGGEVNPGPRYLTKGEYQSGVPAERCPYDGVIIQRHSERALNHYRLACPTCGAACEQQGERMLHPTRPFHVDVADYVGGPQPAAPIVPVTNVPVEVVAEVPQSIKSEVVIPSSVAAPIKEKAAKPAGRPVHRRQGQAPTKGVSYEAKPEALDSDMILDGRHLTTSEGPEFCKRYDAVFCKIEESIFEYDGEQRLVVNRNVTETKQGFVAQRITMTTAFIPAAPIYVMLGLLWFPLSGLMYSMLHDDLHVKGASRISAILVGMGLAAVARRVPRIRNLRTVVAVMSLLMFLTAIAFPSYSWIIGSIVTNLQFTPHVLWFFSPARWGARFKMFGVEWEPSRWAFLSLAVYFVHYVAPGPLMPLVALVGMQLMRRAQRDAYTCIMEALFPSTVKHIWCVPHAVSCALSEYSNGADAIAISSTVRNKLMRLASLPLPDVAHTALMSGSEEVVMFFAQNEPFFEAGAKFVTTPV